MRNPLAAAFFPPKPLPGRARAGGTCASRTSRTSARPDQGGAGHSEGRRIAIGEGRAIPAPSDPEAPGSGTAEPVGLQRSPGSGFRLKQGEESCRVLPAGPVRNSRTSRGWCRRGGWPGLNPFSDGALVAEATGPDCRYRERSPPEGATSTGAALGLLGRTRRPWRHRRSRGTPRPAGPEGRLWPAAAARSPSWGPAWTDTRCWGRRRQRPPGAVNTDSNQASSLRR